ncbi:MAG: radical SAM family heme chaperone HemW [Pirellulales bacterium]|jgi:oxygen-independent coproporphyrinogen-3 oxidase|nr:radical SAM family heme chaperone HemW [Thermoguttaceae bacterium]MDD4788996.1 radical SAM family heme chaperone HemW [Pirellulales bacterium]
MHAPSHPPIGLYVHIPFCASKCAYCDFASCAGREADIPRYVDAVIREIARRGAEAGHPRADTVFLGGGTPSLLDERQTTRILDALFEAFPIEEGAEITCECNPGTLTAPLAHALRKAGVNRLSIGAQARQARLLRLLGRIHDWQGVVASVETARQAGFDNINLDLMFGLPSQNVPDFRETLQAAIALSPSHLSCYGLIVEEGTPISRDIAEGKLALPDEEAERAMYELARQTLATDGLDQYEISNFARPGHACRHNLGCWTRVPYLGFGCAAHSFFGQCRTMNPSRIDAYLAGDEPKTERISREEARFESMMLGLRLTRGVQDEDFADMHGMSIREAFGERLDGLIDRGLLQWHAGALRLTRLGMDLQNSVLVELM